jgi:hypothetical protein
VIGAGGCAQADNGGSAGFDHNHSALDSLLSVHVKDGLVDYAGLQADRDELRKYSEGLGRLEKAAFDGFSQHEQLALLVNAYNAFTLELILKNYPVASIRDIPGNWSDPQWLLLGRKISLNDLENKVIRPDYHEPRIHFALVCAAKGCPPLRAEAYTADKLEQQLAEASRGFARDERFNRLDAESTTLFISKIFEWYGDDFAWEWGKVQLPEGGESSSDIGAVVGFFRDHLGPEGAAFLDSAAVQISYLDYDWDLNEQDPE